MNKLETVPEHDIQKWDPFDGVKINNKPIFGLNMWNTWMA